MHHGLIMEQNHHLHLTAELKQGIQVMGMSAIELSDYVRSCLEENPFLEWDERQDRKHPLDPDEFFDRPSADALMEKLQPHNEHHSGGTYGEIRQEYPFEQYMIDRPTTEDDLEMQLELELRDPIDIAIGKYLVGNLDRNGYLRIDLQEEADRLRVPYDRIERALCAVQACQPAGIGARSIPECLLLQIEALGESSPLITQVIGEFLQDLAAGKTRKIAEALKVHPGDIQQISDLIATLNPRPGLSLDCSQSSVIWPEIIVFKRDDGQYDVGLQSVYTPDLLINDEYVAFTKKKDIDDKVAQYLQDKLRSAQGLMHGIEQRKLTLCKVARCVVNLQQEFFEHGIEHLKPLTMGEVASLTDLNESTISRVANDNYMQTPKGVLEIRYFFHSGLSSSSAVSSSASSKSVKFRIKKLIDEEDSEHPLSDAHIAQQLQGEGVDVSRRTVAKYRMSIGLQSTTQRKRFRSEV